MLSALQIKFLHDGVASISGSSHIDLNWNDLNDERWEKAQIYKGKEVVSDGSIRKAKVIDKSFIPDAYDLIEKEIRNNIFALARDHFNVRFDKIIGSQIVKYETGDFFLPHIDSGRTYPERVLTIIKYLSVGYSGGETYFPEIDLTPKIKAPDYLIFFPELLHGAHPVLSGSKVVFVSWLCKDIISW
ncbi:MAG: 2OG-Fe(II) oxygenase [Pseudomonadota bacterium]